ncbi:phosphotransferase [Microbacterium betulae]|uniref:Phosphotransferase n=1 Tax=Microbacterium betulae TaxID=2981139 RepID=A0AA97FI46_9MICO|nr:phosphotransferase [Microbacterium sp. AB]WOF22479.1 phosphotransferase [Microbacterium sp. AB]
MTRVDPAAGLAAFDRLRRGAPAPAWVRDGILRGWGLPADAAATLIVLSENITFRVDVGDVPTLVVRLGRPGYAGGVDHLRAELLWVEALRADIDAPTPSPVRGADGALVQRLPDESGRTWTAVAFEFVVGTILEEQPDIARHFASIGRLTAQLHEHARSWDPPEDFVRFEWRVRDMVGADARWGDWRAAALSDAEREMLERAEVAARASLDAAGVDRSPAHAGLIHADLRPSNVMTTTDAANPLVVIDFDDCGHGFYLYDFAAALTFYEHRPEALEMAGRWIDGYTQIRPLSTHDLAAAAALSLLRRLTMLGWATTHRADALPSDLWDENLPGTVEVGRRYLSDPLRIVRG